MRTVTTSTTSSNATTMATRPEFVSATAMVATVTPKATATAPPASRSKPVGVSKAMIARGQVKASAVRAYAASVVTVPTPSSTAILQNTNKKDAKFLAGR